jgi:enoyl-[acyl-carrier-protein] reductase (NADH)
VILFSKGDERETMDLGGGKVLVVGIANDQSLAWKAAGLFGMTVEAVVLRHDR